VPKEIHRSYAVTTTNGHVRQRIALKAVFFFE
jgi:hypothetical protein